MTVFAVLLRGINVGGHNRLPMADLRRLLAEDGLPGARTYIQSGNVVLDADTSDSEVLGARVRSVIARGTGLDVPVMALTASGLDDLVRRTPFAAEPDPRRVHAIVLGRALLPDEEAAVSALQTAAALDGARDVVAVIGRVAYLHTPDGFGSSVLAKRLTSGARNPLRDGTARNWATIMALHDLTRS